MAEHETANHTKAPVTAEEMWSAMAERLVGIEQRLSALEAKLTAAAPEAQAPAPPEAREAYDLEHRFTSPLLNYLGLVALLVGLALLIGYYLEKRSVAAILLACVAAGALWAMGQWMHRRSAETFSLTLEGTALGLLCIACYLLSTWGGIIPSLAAAVVVTGWAIHRAIERNSQLVAVFALLAALLGALLLRSVHSGESLLFGYLAAVNGGAVWAGRRKGWIGLRFLALMGSHVVAGFWYWSHPGAQPLLTAAFPVFTFLLFARVVPAGPLSLPETALAAMNSAGFLAASASLLHVYHPALVPWTPVGLAVVHLLFGASCRWSRSLRSYSLVHFWLAGILFAVGIGFAVPVVWMMIGWTAEGALLGWIGTLRDKPALRNAANFLELAAAVAVPLTMHSSLATASQGAITVASLFFAAAVAWRHTLAKQHNLQLGNWEWTTHWTLAAAAAVLPLLALSQQVSTQARLHALVAPSLATSILWALYSMGVCLLGWFRISPFLRGTGVALLLLTSIKVFLVDPVTLSGLTRVVSFLLLSVFLLFLSYLFQTRRR